MFDRLPLDVQESLMLLVALFVLALFLDAILGKIGGLIATFRASLGKKVALPIVKKRDD